VDLAEVHAQVLGCLARREPPRHAGRVRRGIESSGDPIGDHVRQLRELLRVEMDG
jgi:hypothetical protein